MDYNGRELVHPLTLKDHMGWSYSRLADEFGLTELQVRSWGFREGASRRREPPTMAYILATKLMNEHIKEAA